MSDWLPDEDVAFDRLRRFNWDNTPLGPLDGWPDVLRTTTTLAFSSKFPQAIVWGPELITLHNDAFTPILGNKPTALGRPFDEVWEEAWEHIKPYAEAAFRGEPTFIEDFPLMVQRSDQMEQAYFTFCYSPIRDSAGVVVGLLDTVVETTATVIANQKLNLLDAISTAVAGVDDPIAIMDWTCRRMVEHMSLSNCAYADMDPDGDGFTIRGDWAAKAAPRIRGHYRLADFGVQAVQDLNAGRPLVLEDNRRDLPAEASATFQAIGITATVCVPLIKNGQLTALMAIHDCVPRKWSSHEVNLLLEIADRCWAHIERARSDASVRQGIAALATLNATLEKRVEDRSIQLAQAEAALRQSQKLEAIGQLTGGVAHDFNNLLTVIRSSVDFLQQPHMLEERRNRYVQAISDTVDRASKLTSQLLAFSRQQALNPKVFDAGACVELMGDMLRTATGALVNIEISLLDEECCVQADMSQFEIAIVNMALNARDAMGGEGTLRLTIGRCDRLPPIRGHAGTDHMFVAVSLADSGKGIPAGILEKIFEPFFTTKDVGKGTGLGLSQVFGFAKQSGGDIDVQTEEGRGSTFTLYLPKVDKPQDESLRETPAATLPVSLSSYRILVVEDNDEIGVIAVKMLEAMGFLTVRRARNTAEALILVGEDAGNFDVVFSDVLMPGDSGIALANELRRRRVDLPILLTSGYSEELRGAANIQFEFVPKPYSAERVRLALCKILSK